MRNGNLLCLLVLSHVCTVLTVPMRNGNNQVNLIISGWKRVLTVPMRNGNFEAVATSLDYTQGSYRTYEEWKLIYYKAVEYICYRSYRTYEEWKLGSIFAISMSVFFVLTVPMRNGNLFCSVCYCTS